MLRLHPSAHSVPDNVWHTFLIAAVSSFFLWQTGQHLVELFLFDGPINLMEQRLLAGEGHPIQVWLSSVEVEDYPLLLNRIFSFLGWVFSLGLVVRFLKKGFGFVGSLPAVILLFALPGFSVFMSSAGSGSWGVYFFLKAFSILSQAETKGALIRAGVFAGLSVLLSPIWFLPALGLVVGSWELFRTRFKWVSLGFLSTSLLGTIILSIVAESGMALFIPGPANGNGLAGGWVHLLARYLFLGVIPLLLLVYSSKRRGVGWWSLLFCLPLLLLEPFLTSSFGVLLIPFWVFSALGLIKLPVLLNISFPRAYQSMLLCQLLLWIPAYLGTQSLYLYPFLSN